MGMITLISQINGYSLRDHEELPKNVPNQGSPLRKRSRRQLIVAPINKCFLSIPVTITMVDS